MTRICIIGPSNSGKSTLAQRLGQSLGQQMGVAVLHLDQIAHAPGTNWQRVDDQLLIQRQQEFLHKHQHWIIEGNYSVCMAERFNAADTVIWLDPPLLGCIWRYIKRSWQKDRQRAGGLAGATAEFNWGLIKFTLINYPQNKKKYRDLLSAAPHLDIIKLTRFSEIKKFYDIVL